MGRISTDLNTIVVDLDGTLIRSDMLLECLTKAMRQPEIWIDILRWGLKSKSLLKFELARRVQIDVSVLPYNSEVIDFIRKQKSSNVRIVLATASNELLANQIADHLGLFDEVIGSTIDVNLKGRTKAHAITNRFESAHLAYIGNDWSDIHVWNTVDDVYVVNATRSLTARLNKSFDSVKHIESSHYVRISTLSKALRLHQWVKNSLLFTPLIAAHQVYEVAKLVSCFCSFIAFGLVASSVYVLNDLVDIEDDRRHQSKRRRPFASGALPISLGFILKPMLLLAGFALSLATQNHRFTAVLIIYYCITLIYSLKLKTLPIIDVTVLASLYTIRIIAGAFSTETPLSFWFVTFSFFLFTSLAYVKRASELISTPKIDSSTNINGRGYVGSDLSLVTSVGPAAGVMSCLVLALYINDPKTVTMYQSPQLLWLVCPIVLYWISRVWLLTFRGQMPDDPIVFALKDRLSWILVVLSVGIAMSANVLTMSGRIFK
jgi:4-hydroxybenzoate polyprenyltransferase